MSFLCKACNSYLGTAYEGAAASAIREVEEQERTGAVTHPITISNPGGTTLYSAGTFSGSSDADRRLEGTRRGRPNLEAEARFRAERKDGDGLHVTIRRASSKVIKLAFLSWAHLVLFRRLGYSYVFSEAGRRARTALLEFSVRGLGRAFFLAHGGKLKASTEPIRAGLLMRSARRGARVEVLGLAVEFGSTVLALPLSGDNGAGYSRIRNLVGTEGAIGVVPFGTFYPTSPDPVGERVAYLWPPDELPQLALVEPTHAGADLKAAKPPPRGKPEGKPFPDNPAFPPSPLTVPAHPRSVHWREMAADYLSSRGLSVRRSTGEADDLRWIEDVDQADSVAARHLADMQALFHDQVDPLQFGERGGYRVTEELIDLAEDLNPDAVVADLESVSIHPREGFGSHALRLMLGTADQVIGPHYTVETLAYALQIALESGEPRGRDR